MEEHELLIRPTDKHIEIMENTLVGYWRSDCWDVLQCPVLTKKWTRNNRYLKFDFISNIHIKREIKYYIAKRLTERSYSVDSAWRSNFIKILVSFFDKYYPDINSIINISREAMLKDYKKYLLTLGKPLRAQNMKANSGWVMFFLTLYDFLYHFYDEREETEKDIWDVNKLNIDFNEAASTKQLSFRDIPNHAKKTVKRYIKECLIINQTLNWGSVRNHLPAIKRFFIFLSEHHPEWDNIKKLSRDDILEYLSFLHSTPMGGDSKNKASFIGIKPSRHHVYTSMQYVKRYIAYLQKFDWAEAPITPENKLFFPEDFPKLSWTREKESVKYIPDEVWEQVINNIDKLPSKYIPILLILEASGFRISDVLSLKIDCLLEQEDGYWLVGDQIKVKYRSHKVPISDEVARVIKSQQKLVKENATKETNPNNYLFPVLVGLRVRKPVSANSLSWNLNKFAEELGITDKRGDLFYFNNHAFRHRYGVNLINNGMKLLHVQKLMAHATPEMTLVYAKIHDGTLRREWEKTRDLRAIRLDEEGTLVSADLNEQAKENGLELEWIRHNLDSIRLDHGFCVKSPKLNCDFLSQTLEPPCIKNNCRSFHVDQTFKTYYEEQVAKMESDIEVYQKSGRTRSIEIIQPKLIRYREILDGLKNNNDIMGLSKDRREYTSKERTEV